MSVSAMEVKFYGVVESFQRHGVIKCEEAFQMWGQDVYGYKDILDIIGANVGDYIRFGVHVNPKGLPQVSMPAWKCDENGEPINAEGAMFVKCEEVFAGNPSMVDSMKQDIEELSRRGKKRNNNKTPGGDRDPGWREKRPKNGPGGKGKGRSKGKDREADQGGFNSPSDIDQGMLQAITTTAKEPPLGGVIFAREYSISCDLPSDKVEYMTGLAGEYMLEVQEQTGTRLQFEEVEGDLHRLEIHGPLLGLYQAHSVMMGRYHEALAQVEAEESAEAEAAAEGAAPEAGSAENQEVGDGTEAECPDMGDGMEVSVDGQEGAPAVDTDNLKSQIRDLKHKLREAGLTPLRSAFKSKGGGKGGKKGKRR